MASKNIPITYRTNLPSAVIQKYRAGGCTEVGVYLTVPGRQGYVTSEKEMTFEMNGLRS